MNSTSSNAAHVPAGAIETNCCFWTFSPLVNNSEVLAVLRKNKQLDLSGHLLAVVPNCLEF